jgi:ABC-type transport system involved in multi-copper enzyme maturation permease subunit
MKLWGIFRFEVAYQTRRIWPWLIFAVLFVLSFLMARDTSLADAMYEDFFVNSPFSMAKTTVVGSLVWLLVAAVIAGEAAARDVGARMYPLTYTSSVSKLEYLGGRFLAALVLNAVLLLGVQAGMMLGIYTLGIDAKFLAPFRPTAYLTNYAFISLPTAVVATALQFSFATRSGRAMASYAGSMFLMFMSFFVASLLLFKRGLGSLLDPIGMRFIIEDLAHDWTMIERNVRLVTLEGALLANRLLWLGVALAALGFTYVRFHFAHRTESTWWRRRRAHAPTPSGIGVTASAPISVPQVPRTFGIGIQARKTLAVAFDSFRTIAKSWAGLAMLIGLPLLTVLIVIDQMEAIAVPLEPTTARVLQELTGSLANEMSRWLIIPLLIVFFAGELIWREREAGLGEITDAMPGSEWTSFAGKFLGLGFVLAAFTALQMAAGMLAQVLMGYQRFEIGLYLRVLFGLQLPEYLLFVVLALFVHVVVDQKYVGHIVAVIAYVLIAVLAGLLGIEHNLLVFGAGPRWSYTEMRGFGPSLGPWLWFKLYWASWALLLAVVACLLWVRGRENGIRVRIRSARRRLAGPTAWIGAAASVLILASGGFVFYNTNVLNHYSTRSHTTERRAEYERRYRRFEKVPQPTLTGTMLRVELHPARGAAEINGSYRLVNAGAAPIDSIHVATATGGVETGAVTFDRTAALVVDDREHGYRIYDLERPLAPGDTLRLDFEVHAARRGFTNYGVDPSIVAGGSAFTNASWFPMVGYQRQREILSASDRREYGLAPRPLIASLYDEEGREPPARGGGIAFDAVMGTDEDQVAVAPGALRRTWTEGGRRYFHYSTSAPIGNEWAFFAARYAVREAQWTPPSSEQSGAQSVAIRIFHDPKHTAHLDRMMRAARASMDYYTEQFGPYPYTHLTLVEHPAAPGTGMHAEASFVYYGQGIPFWIPKDEANQLDFPYAVLGHEMAHEWGVPYATVEGAPFLAEGLAWYSAIQLVKTSRGSEQLRQLLSFMRQPYPHRPIRRGEPLLRALDPYMSYRKGPFAMYALSEYLGTDRVNGAIRRLLEKHESPGAPLTTTLDLYRELQAVTPDSLKPLLHDLFEVNTFWTFDTNQGTAVETEEGTWQVTLDVEARKVVVDSAGVETRLPMDEWVEIGIFAPAGPNEELGKPIYVQKHRIRSGKQTITVTVQQKPDRAGIDPYNLLDWETGDNIEGLTIRRTSR